MQGRITQNAENIIYKLINKIMNKYIKIVLWVIAVIVLIVVGLLLVGKYYASKVNESDPRFQQMLKNVDKNDPGVVAKSSVNISLMPMYGGFQKTPEQIKGDEEFMNEVLAKYKTKEEASVAFVGFARSYFEKGDLDMAMKRFNEAWLFSDKNPNVYIGFGDILKKRGNEKDAADMYKKAEELRK
jgi:predicted negative regulator of RcsB-dependent stress response